MFNRHKPTLKISFFAILLAMISWMIIGAGGASGNNKHNRKLDDVQKHRAPLIDSELNQLGSTQLQSQPTECSITRSSSHQAGQNGSLNRAQLQALTPPTLIIPVLSTSALPVMQFMATKVEPISDNLRELQSLRHTSDPKATHTRRALGTCTVTTPADSGSGSLRQCLLDITANGTITFDSQVFPPTTPTTISLSSALPVITTDGLTIDGSNAGVVLSGNDLSSEDSGLVVDGVDGVTIKGLQIVNFLKNGVLLFNGASNAVIGGNTPEARNIIGGNKVGIQIAGSGSINNKVIGNYIGTDATGMTALRNDFGIGLTTSAQNNVIGGAGLEGNLISGNEVGLQIQDDETNNNQVLGNLIGTDLTGMAALGNEYGIGIRLGAQNNIIGGETAEARNIISGNAQTGVQIQDTGTNGNQLLGNYIGTDLTGSTPLGNRLGVGIGNPGQGVGPSNNVVGGSFQGARNIISGNNTNGIEIAGNGAANNRVEGNYIGTNATGTQPLKNQIGVFIYDNAHDNIVGGVGLARNLISGNDGGIKISRSNSNKIQGNYIGTDVTGMERLSNAHGIVINDNAQNNMIGGVTRDAGNLISGNQQNGIWIGKLRKPELRGLGTSENQVLGNYIGTDVTGQVALGNRWGITLNESQNNIVGCESLEGCNIISGNSEAGIMIQEASGNQVIGNFIGTDVNGTSALANGLVGIGIIENAYENIIGGQTEAARNIISGNSQTGVDIRDAGTTANQIIGNYIGTDKSGTIALSNRWGVVILEDAHHNIIGGAGLARNLISGNTETGVQIQGVRIEGLEVFGESADHNRVQGNYIGTDMTGLQALGNRWGVGILAGAKNNLIGGTSEGEGNLISGNLESGIELFSFSILFLHFEARENQIQGNGIGVNAEEMALGNGFAGICLFKGTTSNTIGPNNTIANNADAGVRIQDSNTDQNTITQNAIHDNSGLPIDFSYTPVPITPPTLSNWSGNVVSGTACANCQIEIFGNPEEAPAGTQFLVAGNADGNGEFTITLPSEPSCLSATATDEAGTTSEFSDSLCASDPPGSTMTPTATNTPSATPTATNTASATPTATNTPSATPTATNTPSATPTATNTPSATPTATPVTATPTATQTPSSSQLYLPLVLR